MIITLYKNCILSNAYREVFDCKLKDDNNKTARDIYLDSLQQTDIDVDNIYFTDKGKITIELEYDNTSLYEYNYMKFFDNVNNITRYCFIDDIQVVNGLGIISYSEDVWSSYSESMQIRKSLISRSRILDYGKQQIPLYKPPIEYEGNKTIIPKSIDETGQNVWCIVQIQLYKLTVSGKASDRILLTALLKASQLEGSTTTVYDVVPFSWISNYILDAITKSSTEKVIDAETGADTGYYYEITNIIFLPEVYNVSSIFKDSADYLIEVGTNKNLKVFVAKPYYKTGTATQTYSPTDFSNFTILYQINKDTNPQKLANNFKLVGVGTFTKMIESTPNGKDQDLQVLAQVTPTTFSVMLNYNNKLLDITEDYIWDIPIDVQTADATQLQELKRVISTMSGALGLGTTLFTGSLGIATGDPRLVMGGIGAIASAPANFIASTILNNANLYTSNKSSVASNVQAFGALCTSGLVEYIITPDNEQEVTDAINNGGYICSEIVDDIFSNITKEKAQENVYNVVKFDFVNLFGKFPQNIANALKEILTKGVKIFYTGTNI